MIYLASPYTHDSKSVMEYRFREAAKAAGKLMKDGHIVFSPICHTHPIKVECDLPPDFDYWEKYDTWFIFQADKLVVLKLRGWEQSKGVKAEIEIAGRLGKPVEYIEP